MLRVYNEHVNQQTFQLKFLNFNCTWAAKWLNYNTSYLTGKLQLLYKYQYFDATNCNIYSDLKIKMFQTTIENK